MTDNPMIHYVLMRTDLPDYSSGKSMAQANHAGTHMLHHGLKFESNSFLVHLGEWLNEGDGFGICVVLGVTAKEMRRAVELAKLGGIHCGIVHDPSYPLWDGDQMQHLPVDTCAYMLGRKDRLAPIVGWFPLFREPK